MSQTDLPPLQLLGTPVLRVAGGQTLLGGQRPQQLLALLACRRCWVRRDEMAEGLWPDRSTAQARSNLRTALTRAQALPGGDGIEQQSDRLRWLPDSDLQRFDDALQRGELEAALALYGGRLLHGLELEGDSELAQWLAFERTRISARWHDAAGQRLVQLAADPRATVALAEQMLAHEPLDDAALAALAQARLALGEAAQGLQRLEAHARDLASQFALEPSARLQALLQALRQGVAAPGVAVALPVPATTGGFVGRRIERSQLQSLLAQAGCRLLSIVGPGGAGKSALARQATPGGAATLWVALEALDAVDQVPGRCAALLGRDLPAAADAWHALPTLLGAQPWLLVLDGAEHLPALADRLPALLQACPALQVLATSRSRLGLAGEQVLPLEGLPLPDIDETDAEVLRHCDAARLFEARARAVLPSFDLASQAAEVVRLLHAVEGLPLAVEIAAAWVRLLPLRAVNTELARSLDLLDSPAGPGNGAAPGRSRSVRASLDHSWQLLSAGERQALGRLAWLPGPLSREMAWQVAQVGLPTLAALAEKSLLQPDHQGGFALHALLRQHARERAALTAAERAALAARHAEHVSLWLAGHVDFNTGDPGPAVREIERELPHVRAAWQSAIDRGDAGFAARHALTLAVFCAYKGLLAEGLAMMQAAVQAFNDEAASSMAALAHASHGLAHLHWRAGALATAEAPARRALKLAQRLRDWRLAVRNLLLLGTTIGGRGERDDTTQQLLLQALRLARQRGYSFETGQALVGLARLEKAHGRYQAAQGMLDEALDLSRRGPRPNREGTVIISNNLAGLHYARGHWQAALQCYEQAWQESQAAGIAIHQALLMFNLARTQHALGRLDEARHWADRALQRAHEQGRAIIACHVQVLQARIAVAGGNAADARRWLEQALAAARGLALPAEQVRCVVVYGDLRAHERDACAAATLWRWAQGHPSLPADDRDEIATRLRALGGGGRQAPAAQAEGRLGLAIASVMSALATAES